VTLLIPHVHDRPVRILVVDDERDNVEVLEIVLAWEGFFVGGALSGEDALRQVAATPPDLILLDVMMPGIDGYEVARRLKATPTAHHIPIIILTAMAARDVESRGRASGADEVLGKPIDRTRLVEHVKKVLRSAYADYRETLACAASA